MNLASYREGRARTEHQNQIRRRYGFRAFTEDPGHCTFLDWLNERAWIGTDGPSVLFDLATAWLVEHKILLPGATTLARLVASFRDQASRRMWKSLVERTPAPVQTDLNQLLLVAPEQWVSELERLRTPPDGTSSVSLSHALTRPSGNNGTLSYSTPHKSQAFSPARSSKAPGSWPERSF
jgi:hypothetical protein